MNVSDQIIQVLDHLCGKFGLAIDWTSENVLPYVTTLFEKLVTYEIWTSVAWMAFAVIAGIAAIVIITRPGVRDAIKYDFEGPFIVIGLVILCICFIVGIITQTLDIVKCVTFPEMFVFEYIQGLINSGS